MAIDLPPVMPPQLASQQEINAVAASSAAAVSATIAGIEVRVLGNTLLSAAQLQSVLDRSKTPSEAITTLTRRYYSAGHLLVSLRYFRSGNTVTVWVGQSAVKGLRGDPQVTRHFQSLIGDPDLSLAEFDRARVLADLQAKRRGVSYSISYEQHFDDQVILNFQSQDAPDYQPREITLDTSNRGSRFLGRYFGAAGFRQHFSTGTEATLVYQTAFPELGEAGDGDEYHQLEFRLDHPFTYGLYGINASHIRYEREPEIAGVAGGILGGICLPPLISCGPGTTSAQLDAEITELAVTGEQVLYSNPVRRLNAFQRLEHTDSKIELAGSHAELLAESYETATLGLRYASRANQLDVPQFLKAELGVSVGLSGDSGSFASDGNSRGVSIGKRSAEFVIVRPQLAYQRDLAASLQLNASFQAQLTGDKQLPQQQQFVLGGMESLSAFLPGVLIGDRGYYLKLELSSKQQWWGLDWAPGVFVEYGASEFVDAGTALGERQSLSDAGLRLKLALPRGFETELLAAASLHEDVIDERRGGDMEADFFWRLRWRY